MYVGGCCWESLYAVVDSRQVLWAGQEMSSWAAAKHVVIDGQFGWICN